MASAHEPAMAEERLTAERLCERLGLETDQLQEWQELGLVAPDADGYFGVDAVERVRLIAFARGRDIAPREIARLSEARGADVLAHYIDLIGGPRPPGRSLEEAAELAGFPVVLVHRFRAAGGLGEEAEVFDDDLDMMRAGATALELGLPEEALLQMVRVLADALTRVADSQARLFHLYVHEQLRATGLPQHELADTVRSISRPLIEQVEPSILYFHRRAWVRAVLEDMVVHLREDLAPEAREIGEVPVAVVFVDLASFTALTEAMGDAEAARVLDRFSDLVRESAAAYDGRVLKQMGDEFMLVFPSSGSAVRIGAHSGTALYREADYLGATINIAARVAAQAGRGEFLVTGVVGDDVGQLPDVSFEPVGPRQLKGVSETLELFAATESTDDPRRVVDPVCGMELDPGACDIVVSWRDRDYFFCSESCGRRFEEAPEQYLS
jgi:adenylate cyclase